MDKPKPGIKVGILLNEIARSIFADGGLYGLPRGAGRSHGFAKPATHDSRQRRVSRSRYRPGATAIKTKAYRKKA